MSNHTPPQKKERQWENREEATRRNAMVAHELGISSPEAWLDELNKDAAHPRARRSGAYDIGVMTAVLQSEHLLGIWDDEIGLLTDIEEDDDC